MPFQCCRISRNKSLFPHQNDGVVQVVPSNIKVISHVHSYFSHLCQRGHSSVKPGYSAPNFSYKSLLSRQRHILAQIYTISMNHHSRTQQRVTSSPCGVSRERDLLATNQMLLAFLQSRSRQPVGSVCVSSRLGGKPYLCAPPISSHSQSSQENQDSKA